MRDSERVRETGTDGSFASKVLGCFVFSTVHCWRELVFNVG